MNYTTYRAKTNESVTFKHHYYQYDMFELLIAEWANPQKSIFSEDEELDYLITLHMPLN